MLVSDLFEKQVWAKSGQKIVRKYRCTSGNRQGRVVKSAAQCFSPIDMKKRLTFKKTKAKLGSKMIRKARKTKRLNPQSKKVRALNKTSR